MPRPEGLSFPHKYWHALPIESYPSEEMLQSEPSPTGTTSATTSRRLGTSGSITADFRTADFGNKRLADRLQQIGRALGDAPSESIPSACEDWASVKGTFPRDLPEKGPTRIQVQQGGDRRGSSPRGSGPVDIAHHRATRRVQKGLVQRGLVQKGLEDRRLLSGSLDDRGVAQSTENGLPE